MKISPISQIRTYHNNNNPNVKHRSFYTNSLVSDTVSFKAQKKEYPKVNKLFLDTMDRCVQNPQLYCIDYFIKNPNDVRRYFTQNLEKIAPLTELNDVELIDILLRKRIGEGFDRYIDKIHDFTKNIRYEVLKNSLNCKNTDGTELNPCQKVQIIDLLEAYKLTHADMKQFVAMSKSGVIDFDVLKKEIFNWIMQNCEYDKDEIENIPKEKLLSWNMELIHTLPSSMARNKSAFCDLIRLANEPEDFKTTVTSLNNEFGIENEKVKDIFEQYGLNFEKWFYPSPQNNIIIKNDYEKTKFSQLKEINAGFTSCIEDLRQTQVKNFIDKKYKNYIVNDKFVLPEKICLNKFNMKKFVENFIKELEPVWIRAENNLKNEAKQSSAISTLQKEQLLKNMVMAFDSISDKKSLDLTIKMWDRIPQKDLFQGNYSTCCIAMGNTNSNAMPEYLLNAGFNIIELIDNKNNKTIGNALCYYIDINSDNNKGKALVIDSIEINNSLKPIDNEDGILIKKAITEFARKTNEDVAGDKNLPVYICSKYNAIPIGNENEVLNANVISSFNEYTQIYLDTCNGWIFPNIDKSLNERSFFVQKLI